MIKRSIINFGSALAFLSIGMVLGSGLGVMLDKAAGLGPVAIGLSIVFCGLLTMSLRIWASHYDDVQEDNQGALQQFSEGKARFTIRYNNPLFERFGSDSSLEAESDDKLAEAVSDDKLDFSDRVSPYKKITEYT